MSIYHHCKSEWLFIYSIFWSMAKRVDGKLEHIHKTTFKNRSFSATKGFAGLSSLSDDPSIDPVVDELVADAVDRTVTIV